MNILILVISLLSMLAGASKGICDSIEFHNGYEHLGYFWGGSSWQIKYHPQTFMQKLVAKVMGASLNAWHVFDWIKATCYFLSIFCAYYCPEMLWFEWLSLIGFQVFFYLVFFKLFYR